MRSRCTARALTTSQAMVDAVNGVFLRAEQRDGGEGAFLLRDDLPFIAVGAQGRGEVWSVEGQAQPALTVWHLASDEPVAKGAYLEAMAAGAASEIVRLLDLGQRGRAGFSKEGALSTLRPSDIAVLVRDFSEAQAIRGELAARGVRFIGHRKVDQYCVGNDSCGEKESALAGGIRALKGCEAVLCSKIGYEPWGLLEAAGIQPNGEHAMEPIEEAVLAVYQEMIASGRLAQDEAPLRANA